MFKLVHSVFPSIRRKMFLWKTFKKKDKHHSHLFFFFTISCVILYFPKSEIVRKQHWFQSACASSSYLLLSSPSSWIPGQWTLLLGDGHTQEKEEALLRWLLLWRWGWGAAAGGTDTSLVLGVGVGERDPDVADSVAYLTGQWFLFWVPINQCEGGERWRAGILEDSA